MSALYPTRVPVPRTYALSEVREVLGGPFFVMKRIVHGISDLHEVDPGAVSETDFARPGGFLARQVRRWEAQQRASCSRTRSPIDGIGGPNSRHGIHEPMTVSPTRCSRSR